MELEETSQQAQVSASEPRVELRVDGGLAHLRLVRPQAGNAIDPAWVSALDDAVTACESDAAVRAVLVSADGPTFTVGGDLRHFASRVADLDVALAEMVPPYHATLARLAALDAPVVCALQGAVAGGGLGLAYCADLVLAAPEARFACGFGRLGLSGDGGSSWFLPRLVGLRRTQELMIGGRQLSAAEAPDWGLITRVVPSDELHAQAEAAARELAAGPTVALAHIRRLLRESWGATLEHQLAAETAAVLDCGTTRDGREGVAAFADRRTPRFEGR
jgi:2-(1,2-epoxy-1,2-dihydrophenyl)acetyl-CoA isomerase